MVATLSRVVDHREDLYILIRHTASYYTIQNERL